MRTFYSVATNGKTYFFRTLADAKLFSEKTEWYCTRVVVHNLRNADAISYYSELIGRQEQDNAYWKGGLKCK